MCATGRSAPDPMTWPGRERHRLFPPRPALAVATLVLAAAALGPVCVPGPGGADDVLTIGCYSVVREAFREGILPAFREEWRHQTGRTVRFEESYNASGAQAR